MVVRVHRGSGCRCCRCSVRTESCGLVGHTRTSCHTTQTHTLLPCLGCAVAARGRAVDARLEWAAKEMFGGQLLFAFLIGHLITAASVTLRQGSASERKQFSEPAGRILDHVLLKNHDSLQLAAMAGQGEVLAALAAAKQQLPL